MIDTAVRLLVFASITSAVMAQTPGPKFEVASVKACKPGDAPSGGGRSGGPGAAPNGSDPIRLRLECQTLDRLIRLAYIRFAEGKPGQNGLLPPVSARMMNQEIAGEPAWPSSERFTIDAKPETPQTMEMMRGPMLQALLEDRFQLKIHHVARELPVYALVVAKGGAKLQASTPDSCVPLDQMKGLPTPNGPKPCGAFVPDGSGGTKTFGQTMAGLCLQFSALLDRDVVDRTGIPGKFDIVIAQSHEDLFPPSTPGDTVSSPDFLSAIMTAVQKLGLRIEPAKANSQFLAIDRVERPSEN